MRDLNFTDINGTKHSIRVKSFVDESVKVPEGFSHYMTIDGSINIVGEVNIMNIGDIFINDETGDLKTLLQLGTTPYKLIGKLDT